MNRTCDKELSSFKKVAKIFSIETLIKLVFDGKLHPYNRQLGKGLNKYYFSSSDLTATIHEVRQLTLIPVKDISTIVGARHDVIVSWIKRGLFKHEVVSGKFKIKLEYLREFQESYITLGEIKNRTNKSKSMVRIIRKLSENGVLAITGPSIDGENGYLFVRSEVLPVLASL